MKFENMFTQATTTTFDTTFTLEDMQEVAATLAEESIRRHNLLRDLVIVEYVAEKNEVTKYDVTAQMVQCATKYLTWIEQDEPCFNFNPNTMGADPLTQKKFYLYDTTKGKAVAFVQGTEYKYL